QVHHLHLPGPLLHARHLAQCIRGASMPAAGIEEHQFKRLHSYRFLHGGRNRPRFVTVQSRQGRFPTFMIRRIAAGDRKVMLHVNQWLAPKWIRAWMLGASRAGDGWLWIVLGLVLLLFGGERRFDALEAGF